MGTRDRIAHHVPPGIWMTIEECTNPAVVWERDHGAFVAPVEGGGL